MEISIQPQPVQSPIVKEATPFIRVSGEYGVLKQKSKNEILSVSEKELVRAIEKANKAVQGTEHIINYKVHEATKEIVVQIMDKGTREIVHEIPPEKFIDLIEKLKELTVGAIIDEKR